jgi:hypothetical protein
VQGASITQRLLAPTEIEAYVGRMRVVDPERFIHANPVRAPGRKSGGSGMVERSLVAGLWPAKLETEESVLREFVMG